MLGIVAPLCSSSFTTITTPSPPIETRQTGQDARSTHSTSAAPDAGTALEANGLQSSRSLALQHQTDCPASREATAHQEGLVCRSSSPSKEHGKSQLANGSRALDSCHASKWAEADEHVNSQTAVKAAMPQLVPFYFVNEVTFTFAILPLLIYVFSKYILPRNLRLYAARLFTSKL